MSNTPQQSVARRKGIPDWVVLYAQRTRSGESVIECYHLHFVGGLNAKQCSERLQVHHRTAIRWLRDMKDLDGEHAETLAGSATPVPLAAFDADSLAAERMVLYDEARTMGSRGLATRQKLLADEQRRLGLDIQRIEQRTLTVQLSLLPPEQRRDELLRRVASLQDRGVLPGGVASQPLPPDQPPTAAGAPPQAAPLAPLNCPQEPSISFLKEAAIDAVVEEVTEWDDDE